MSFQNSERAILCHHYITKLKAKAEGRACSSQPQKSGEKLSSCSPVFQSETAPSLINIQYWATSQPLNPYAQAVCWSTVCKVYCNPEQPSILLWTPFSWICDGNASEEGQKRLLKTSITELHSYTIQWCCHCHSRSQVKLLLRIAPRNSEQ